LILYVFLNNNKKSPLDAFACDKASFIYQLSPHYVHSKLML